MKEILLVSIGCSVAGFLSAMYLDPLVNRLFPTYEIPVKVHGMKMSKALFDDLKPKDVLVFHSGREREVLKKGDNWVVLNRNNGPIKKSVGVTYLYSDLSYKVKTIIKNEK